MSLPRTPRSRPGPVATPPSPRTPRISFSNDPAPNILFLSSIPVGLAFPRTTEMRTAAHREDSMGTANFGIAGLDWQQRVNWDRMREYRIERAREMMKKHKL